MSTALTREQIDLRDAVADLMTKHSPESQVRRFMVEDTGRDAGAWADLAAMGLLGLAVPEEFGGAGAGAAELAVVSEQMGRSLMCGPFLSAAVLTPFLLLALGDDAECAETLPQITAGKLIASVAFAEADDDLGPRGRGGAGQSGRAGSARPSTQPRTIAITEGDRWLLTGDKTYVLDGVEAERLYVTAQSDYGHSVFAVDRSAPGLSVSPLRTVDRTRRLGSLTLARTPARLIGDPGSATHAIEAALDRSALALVAEQSGGALHVTAMAADYARTRYQFGRAIGSFQAVKHLCVDMLLEAQSAVSAARHVAAAFDSDDPDRCRDLALAQAFCSDAYVFAAATNIQVHGGIGFTWDHPAHLYLRRARSDAQIFGDPAWHRERYVRLGEENS